MNKTQEALKMAIEQIKWADHLHDWHDGLYEALKTCKEALAELEQQPKVTGFIRTLETVDKDGIETWKLEPFFTLQSLQEHDNEVIEKCAKVCELVNERHNDQYIDAALRDCFSEIIALKGKQNETT